MIDLLALAGRSGRIVATNGFGPRMKIGTTEKLKFKNLQRRLHLPLWQAVGLLETIWKVAYRNAPAGDIGKLSNEELAGAIEWGDDADDLVNAMIETKWFDADPTHRLLIHDWEQECEAWLRGNFERNKKQFAKPSGINATEPSKSLLEATKQTVEEPPNKPSLSSPSLSYHPPSSPDEPAEPAVTWAGVVGELILEGVELAEDAAASAKKRGCTSFEAMTVINQWRSFEGAYGVGLLVSKIRNLRPDSRINWPPLPPEYAQKKQRDAAVKTSNDSGAKLRSERAELENARTREQAERDRLEGSFGKDLDSMPRNKVRHLIETSWPKEAEILLKLLPTRGAPKPGGLRTKLLGELESVAKRPTYVLEDQSC